MTTEWLKKATALAAAFALAAAALPASAHPVSADSAQDTDRVSGAVNLDSKITFSGSENYGGALDDSFKAIARTKDGGYVAVGYSWAASKGDYLQAVCAMEDNEFVVLGYSASSDAGDWENSTGTTCGLAISYDSEGEVNWAVANNIGGSAGLTTLKRSRFFGGCVDQNGDVIAVGDIQIGRSLYPSQIVKLDGMSGETVWSRIVGTDRTEDPTDLSENHTSCFTDVDTLTDGSYAVVGYSKGYDYLTEEALDAVGTQDSVIVRYGADGSFLNGEVVGTIDRMVDFTGITATSDGGYFAYGSADSVGESTSESGNPVYGNNGKNDATAFATFAFGSGEQMTEDSENVVWADGTYEDSANGYHGPITVSVTVENHTVSEVREVSHNETSSYYKRAKAVYDTIREANTWDVDSVSGATLSSNGIKKAVKNENVLPATDCTSGTAVDGGMTDTNKHGTGVLGELIAIRDNGIGIAGLLDEVKIAPIKVNAKKNATADLEAAVYAAVDKYNASVITMSLGNTTFNTEGFREAIAYAASKNVLIVAAAGNDGKEDLVYPAAFDNVIGVGYVDSNFEIAEKSQRNESIDVTAPGVDMIVPYPSMRTHCTVSGGTSYAAPMVAAMAAAAKQMNPDITHDEFLALLKETSTDRGEEGYDTAYGNGTFAPNAKCTRAMIVTFIANYAKNVAGTYAEPAEKSSFTDVGEGDWFKASVDWAVANGITNGYGEGTFRPNVNCNRAMMAAFLRKAAAVGES